MFLSGLVCYLALIGFQIENWWEWILLPLLVFTIGCWAIGVILLIVMVLMLIVFNLFLRNLPYVRAHRKFHIALIEHYVETEFPKLVGRFHPEKTDVDVCEVCQGISPYPRHLLSKYQVYF